MMATTQVLPLPRPSLSHPFSQFFRSFPLLTLLPLPRRNPRVSLSSVPAFLLTLCREASLLSLTATDFLDGTPSFSRAPLSFASLDLYFASLGVDWTQWQAYTWSTVVNLTNNTRSIHSEYSIFKGKSWISHLQKIISWYRSNSNIIVAKICKK